MRPRLLLLFILLAPLPACGTVTTGTLTGQIRLEPRAPEIDAQLGNDPPTNSGAVSVHAYPASGNAGAASTAYDTGGAQAGGLAFYELLPEIPDGGPIPFRVTVNALRFGAGGEYRFGSEFAGGTGALLTPPVARDTVTPYDIRECAALVETTVTLSGVATDLNRLNDPAQCTVVASLQEVAGSWSPQARSAPTSATLSQLRGNGVAVPMLVRAGTLPVRLTATCTAATNESCFPQDPQQPGYAIFSRSLDLPMPACATRISASVAIPVTGTAGTVMGQADLVGSDEGALQIKLQQPNVTPRAALVTDLTSPPHDWSLVGVPEGNWDASASAIVNGGQAAIEFPHRRDPEPVTVSACAVTDLGNTFVAAPAKVTGMLTLRDPRSLAGQPTDLQWLHLGPFDPIFNQPVSIPQRTVVFAAGDPDYYVAPDGTLGGNGTGAQSFAVPTGAFDPATGEAVLSYELPIVGLSEVQGAADGSQAKPTRWKLEGFDIGINKIVNGVQERYQAVRVDSGLSDPLLFQPGGSATASSRSLCVGEARLKIAFQNVNAYELQFQNIIQNAVTQAANEEGTPLTYTVTQGRGWGAPRESQAAASSVSLAVTMPAGRQYKVFPSVRVVSPTSGSESFLSLGERLLPLSGGVRCGDRSEDCEVLAADGTRQSRLGVELTSPGSYCEPTPDLPVALRVTSTSGSAVRVEISLDGGPLQTVCSPCTGLDSISHTFANVPPGTHTIRMVVSDGSCSVDETATVFTAAPLDMTCPADFSVAPTTPAGTVPYAEIASRLVPVWTGGCAWNRPAVSDDHPAEFPRGETTVAFTPADPYGNERCKTRVTVEAPAACNSVRDVAAGDKGTYWRNGEVRYQVFTGNETLKLVNWNPDGKTDLALPPRGIGVNLPFAASWLKITYGVYSGDPIRIRGYTPGNQLVFDRTTDAGQSQTQLHCLMFSPSQSVNRLTITGGGGEGVVREVCYARHTPAGAMTLCQ